MIDTIHTYREKLENKEFGIHFSCFRVFVFVTYTVGGYRTYGERRRRKRPLLGQKQKMPSHRHKQQQGEKTWGVLLVTSWW